MIDAADVEALEQCLRSGGVSIFPTDTVYGIGCAADSVDAWRRISLIKGRPDGKPAAVMFGSVWAAQPVLRKLVGRTRRAAETLLPGPITLILPDVGGFPFAARDGRIGIRVPNFDDSFGELYKISTPILQTSANPAGGSESCSLDEVPREIREAVDLQLEGPTLRGVASTVLDLGEFELTGEWRVLREGAVSADEVERVLRG